MRKTTLLFMSLFFLSVLYVAGQGTTAKIRKAELLKAASGQVDVTARFNSDEMTALKNFEALRALYMQSKDPSAKARLFKQMSKDMEQILGPASVANKEATTKQKLSLQANAKVNAGVTGRNLKQKIDRSIYQSALKNKVPLSGVMKHRLDSIVNLIYNQSSWIKESKQAFEYNYNGKLTKNANFDYSSIGNLWMNDDESKISYDDKGRLTGYVNKTWDSESANPHWVINDSMNIQYDNNGNKILDERYNESFDELSGKYVLTGDYKSEYTYSQDNEETGSIFYTWDTEAGEWVPESKHEVSIQNGIEVMLAAYMWNPELKIWVGHWKFEHFPVPGYNMMGSVFYWWDETTNQWYVNSKEEYEVGQNESGVVITSTYYQSDYETKALSPTVKTVYSEPVAAGHNLQQSFRTITGYSWNTVDGVWVNDTRTKNTFDDFGNLVLAVDSVWAFSKNEWMIDHKTESTVNTAGLITETVMSDWEYDMFSGTNTLTSKDKQSFTYDTNNNVTEKLTQSWDFTAESWKNAGKYTYAYDIKGNILVETWYENYIPETQTWVALRKFEYTYDEEDNQVSYAFYNWMSDTNSWRLGTKNEYDENENGEVILDAYTSWNDFLNKEVIDHKKQKVYDNHGNLVMELTINSNVYFDGTQYYLTVYGDKQEYVFDANNRLTSQIWYDYTNDQFVGSEKYIYSYDSNHPEAMSTETSYKWNATNNVWDLNTRGELTYNFEVPKSEILLPFGEEEESSREVRMYFNFMPLEFTGSEWNAATSTWDLSEKTVVYYALSEFSSTDNINADKWAVYPNPVSDYVSVKLPVDASQAQFKIFDVQGRVVTEKNITDGTLVDLSGLVNGMYFYQIMTASETLKGKLIKK
ncbi:MAG: T9SS type A sorting domain-containing protein [Paludibacter sp.]|nr:T9SS type A sorting domain-containing protein [Paludibacter sp.]